MKKLFSILLAIAMLAVGVCAALADTVPQTEGGRKFESDWAIPAGRVRIDYEEEGYRVQVTREDLEKGIGSVWEYSCYYHEDTDSLVSVSSSRTPFTVSPENGEKLYQEAAYEGLDDVNQNTEFTIDGQGHLIWKDGRENAGAGLAFTNIGRLEGVWKNEAEEVEVEFMWDGIDPDTFRYTVHIQRGKIGAEHYALFLMTGEFDPATGRLSADGTCTLFTRNASGEYDIGEDGENYDAFFSLTKDGHLLYETENGIELTYDLLGHQS